MARRVENVIELEDVQIIYRNFSGRETEYNAQGTRTFSVVIPNEELAEQLAADGWNIKRTKPNDDYPEGRPHLPVTLGYKIKPPQVWQITSRNRVQLPETFVSMLDDVTILTADMIIGPYNYEVRGETGVKAYLRALYVTIEENRFDQKYADIPDTTDRSSGPAPWDE